METHPNGVGGQGTLYNHATRAAGRGRLRPDRALTA
jgi:hypothetical protein